MQETHASFSDYFLKFYTEPYGLGFHEQTLRYMDYIIRFEDLNADFRHVLSTLGVASKQHPLRRVNPTRKNAEGYHTFYTPEAIERARKVFGFFMRTYGYEISGVEGL